MDAMTATPTTFRPVHVARWLNLRAEFGARGWSQKDAVEALSRAQAQISHISADRPIRAIGDQLATDLEGELGLDPGALDAPACDGPVAAEPYGTIRPALFTAAAIDDATLDEAEKWVRFEEGVYGRYQPLRRNRRLMVILEMLVGDGGRLTPAHAAELVNSAKALGGSNARVGEPSA